MSYMPQLKTSSIGETPRRTYRTESNTTRGNTPSRVRFTGNNVTSKTPISLSQREREKRKHQALDFLKTETSGVRKPSYSSVKRTTGSTTPSKGYDSLPGGINTFPSRTPVFNENTLRNVQREAMRQNPLLSSPRTERVVNSRMNDSSHGYQSSTSTNYRNNTGILSSLGNFGSKVLNSILYNEDVTGIEEPYIQVKTPVDLTPVRGSDPRSKRLDAELQATELELQVAERKRYLRQLNEEINKTENSGILGENESIDKKIGKLDQRLQNILEEVNGGSTTKLLKELESIKDELTSLRRKQESNNIKFESKFEDMMMENQMNRQKFDNLYKDLEEKRKELDLEKNTLIKLLRDSKDVLARSSDDVDRLEDSEQDSFDEDHKDEDNDEARDILRYLMQHKRKNKSNRSKSRLRQIRNNLDNIEKVTK